MKKILLFFIAPVMLFAQRQSVMQEQSNYYSQFQFTKQAQWDSLYEIENGVANVPQHNIQKTNSTANCVLNKKVYGWLPYWTSSTIHNNFNWSMLSELVYFDYQVSQTTGNNTNTSFAWSTSPAVTAALSNSVNVHFCASMFNNHSTFFASSTAQQTFINNTISLLNSRGAHGVNIDFELMQSSHKVPFKNFMINLCNQVHAANPNYKVTIALESVDWNGIYDLPALNNVVDYFIIMGYDYYYGGSSIAGPSSPFYNYLTGFNYHVTKSVNYFINNGISKNKLMLGLPYYGRDWQTATANVGSATTSSGLTRTLAYVKNNPSTFSLANKKWDNNAFSSYYTYMSGGNNRQCWIDDEYSLGRKYDFVNQRGLAGIGIWALGQDNGYQDYWNVIKNKLSNCAVVSCNDSIYDMGGPNRNYQDNESYVYTIDPTGNDNLRLTFSQFDLQAGADSLYLYNGSSTTSPLIGAYTGTVSPGIVNSTNQAITVKFKSNGSTTKQGFRAKWNCIQDAVSPTTQINTPSGWITQHFVTNYTDADNLGGSGIDKKFYQPSYFNGTEWRANGNRGFVNDEFNTPNLHSDWTSSVGTWTVASGALMQSDETNSNTNIYTTVDQTISNRYLYHFKANITGVGANRRGGLHFMCDDATQTNRGNNYLVMFRPDQSNIQIYEATTNTLTLMQTTSYTFAVGTTYDFKIYYDRTTGEIVVWVNNTYVSSWADSTPLTLGNAISFRAAECNLKIDDVKTYRSRISTNTIFVGAATTNDLRNENPSPNISAGKITSIVKDNANNLSSIDAQLVDVDWTEPEKPLWLKDGLANDFDTTNIGTQLDFNYNAAKDTNSGVTNYYYAIGTSLGLQDVLSWTSNGTVLSGGELGLSLLNNQKYYVMIKAINGAGLVSDSVVADGILYLTDVGINDLTELLNDVAVFPNPTTDNATLTVVAQEQMKIKYEVTDALGKIIEEKNVLFNTGYNHIFINTSSLSKGVYYLNIFNNNKHLTKKIIVQ